MNYTTEIKQYISQLKTNSGNPAGEAEKHRTENALTVFCEKYMQTPLKTWPDNSDYETYHAEINRPDNPKYAKEYVNRVKKFFAWLTLERLTASKLYDDNCLQCFTILECADLGGAMNYTAALLKDIYTAIIGDNNPHGWKPACENERRVLIGYTIACGDNSLTTGLTYLHTNDLDVVRVYDTEKARNVFFSWLKSATLRVTDFTFDFKLQYEYALSIIKERLIILNAENPITIDIDAKDTQTIYDSATREFFPVDSDSDNSTQPDNSTAANEPEAQNDDETSTDITAHVEPEIQPAKKKPGRKRFDTVNGEKKSEKLMLYLTPELISRIRVWCDMKGVSNVGFITGLIEDFLKDKEESINTFLEFRKGL